MHGMEVWKTIPGYDGAYEASSLGRIRSLPRTVSHLQTGRRLPGGILKPRLNKRTGYPSVNLAAENARRTYTVHALVAAAFFGPRPLGMEVAHCDGNKLNPSADNLRYATCEDNASDKRKHGTLLYGGRLRHAKLDEAKVKAIRNSSSAQRELAIAYGVSEATISRVKSRVDWGWVK